MKKIIFVILLLVSVVILFFPFYKAISSWFDNPMPDAVQTAPAELKKPSISDLIAFYASKYQVSEKTLNRVINCEDVQLDPNLQSELHYKFSDPKRNIVIGEQERSFGLVQIHLPDHPEVSMAEATDPDFAINFLAKEIKKGHGDMWTCY